MTDVLVRVNETGDGPYAQWVRAGKHVQISDEPPELGGGDRGPTPDEYLAAALGACTAITLRMYAGRKAWPVERIEVEVRLKRPEDSFERNIKLEGKLTDEQRARLVQIASHCPVSRTLEKASTIVTRLA